MVIIEINKVLVRKMQWQWQTVMQQLNNNKLLLGLAMISMNIGSRYLIQDITKEHESIMMTWIFKQIVLFFIFFMATRDILFSIMLTAMFTVTMKMFLNKDSMFNMLPRKLLLATQTIQPQQQIAKQDYERAQEIIALYERMQNDKNIENTTPMSIDKALKSPINSYFLNVSKLAKMIK